MNPVNPHIVRQGVDSAEDLKEDRLRGTAETERLATRENKLSSFFLHHIIIIIIISVAAWL